MTPSTTDLRIESLEPLISPAILSEELPATPNMIQSINAFRKQATDIIKGDDPRLLVICGPCSIHDPAAALEYAKNLSRIHNELHDHLFIVMRVYFEKPRTTIGWKGLINDPDLDGSFRVNQGLHLARKLLVDIAHLNLPTGTEFLDTIIPQFLADLISWGAIGARTTESQIHRELASGLSMPIGFKNGTGGSTQIAIDAIRAASHPHHFLGVTKDGIAAIVATKGNDSCHIILRGSNQGTNYSAKVIAETCEKLHAVSLSESIMIDCSHGNSGKDYTKQPLVAESVGEQIASGNHAIRGIMLESNLIAGNQKLVPGEPLTYGQSITDACLSWKETETVLRQLSQAVKKRATSKSS